MGAFAPHSYEGTAAVLVRALKYGRWRSVALPMAEAMTPVGRRAKDHLGGDQPPVIVPVPLSASRLRERGFNQAEELALRVADGLGLQVVSLLGRAPGRQRQAGAGIVRRAENVQGSFFLADTRRAGGGSALLVDDVLTTGATTLACVDVLSEAGFLHVAALTFARTLRAPRAPSQANGTNRGLE
ncbi:MAG: ComF family protein [Gemmatimonadota bacterium]